jgi:hypothetical protein
MTHRFLLRNLAKAVDRALRRSMFYFVAPNAFGTILAIARQSTRFTARGF